MNLTRALCIVAVSLASLSRDRAVQDLLGHGPPPKDKIDRPDP